MNPLTIVSSLVTGVFGFFKKKQDIKANKQAAEAKLIAKKADANLQIELTDAEWESIALKSQLESWKDEYVTLIITLPIPLIFVGSLLAALGFANGELILQGTLAGIASLKDLGMDYGFLINAVVMAAIGLKVWRA